MEGLSPALLRLITNTFNSVEAIELTLLLRRSPDTFWSADAAATHLGISPTVSSARLSELAAAGVLVRGATSAAYRFAPAQQLAADVDALADSYTTRRIEILNAIYSANLIRIRAFADAFKLKKDE